jgi:hypothetical protein
MVFEEKPVKTWRRDTVDHPACDRQRKGVTLNVSVERQSCGVGSLRVLFVERGPSKRLGLVSNGVLEDGWGHKRETITTSVQEEDGGR